MKVVPIPEPLKENPYQNLLYSHMKDVEVIKKKSISLSWILSNEPCVIHLHWLGKSNILLYPFKLLYLMLRLKIAKSRGYKIVWTVHNLEPHERRHKLFDHFAHKFLANNAHSIIVHSNSGKKELLDKLNVKNPEKRVKVIYHGNYIGWYQRKISRKEARKKLGIKDDEIVFMNFGMIRNYKNVPLIIDSFKRLKGNYRLILAGKPFSEQIKNSIECEAGKDNRIITALKFIPDNDVQVYFMASDIVLLPFKSITTSGSLLLAMSFGKPVLAFKSLFISEIVDESYGMVIENENNLADAMEKMSKKNLSLLSQNSLKKAKRFSWDKIGKQTLEAYK